MSWSLGIALKKMFRTTLKISINTINFNFFTKFFKVIPLVSAKTINKNDMEAKKITLLIVKVRIVSRTRKIIFDIGFNLCIKDFPGK